MTLFKDGLSTKPMCSHSKNCFPFRYGGTITNQIRRLGASCDWSRERFTLDEQLSRKCCWWCCLYLVLLHINVLLSLLKATSLFPDLKDFISIVVCCLSSTEIRNYHSDEATGCMMHPLCCCVTCI